MLYTPENFLLSRLGEDITVEDTLKDPSLMGSANYPWGKQMEIFESVRNNQRTMVQAGHNVGKTHIAARVGLWFLYAFPPSIVITTAPKQTQVRDLLWGRWRQAWNKEKLGGECLTTRCFPTRDIDSWFALGMTARDAESFSGWHEENMLFIFDEASGIPDHIYIAVEGMLGGANTKILLIGNPTTRRGKFFEASRDPDYNRIVVSCLDHPNVVHQKPIYRAAVAPSWPQDRRKKWGANSTLFRVRVRGEFPQEDADTLIPYDWVDESLGIDRTWAETLDRSTAIKTVYGVDCGGGGLGRGTKDPHVVCKLSEHPSGLHFEILGKFYEESLGDIAALIARDRGERGLGDYIGFDAVGVGAGLDSLLIKEGIEPNMIVPFKASYAVENMMPDTPSELEFENLGAEAWWALRRRFEEAHNHRYISPKRALWITDDENLMLQLTERRYFTRERSSKIMMEPKEKLEHSCDEADSVVIAYRTYLKTKGGRLEFEYYN